MHPIHDDLRGLDLNLVPALDALLAERHVTRAAKRLGITQSAASHALARLRELFGDPLLVRGPGGTLVATPRAERLAPRVHRVLGELAAVVRGEVFEPARARRTFRVNTSDYVELVLLPRLAARLARAAPGIDLAVHALGAWGDDELAAGALDAVIGPPRPTARPGGRYERALFDDDFVCVLRRGHPLARTRMTLARYCAASHVRVAPRGTPGSLVDDALTALGRSRHVALTVPHFLVVPHVVAGSDLVATLARRVAAPFVAALDLVAVPPPVALPRFRIALSWHERNHADAPQRWFRDQVLAVAAEAR